MKTTIVLSTAICAVLSLHAVANGVGITKWRSENTVYDVSFRDGTLALGTSLGLVVLHDGALKRFTREDGLPYDEVLCVVVKDKDTVYVGPFGSYEGPQRLCVVRVSGDHITVEDITPDPPFQKLVNVMDIGPEGMLWASDQVGLRCFDGEDWCLWRYDDGTFMGRAGSIAFGADGRIWIHHVSGRVLMFDGSGFNDDGLSVDEVVGANALGEVFLASRYYGLHKLQGSSWVCLSSARAWRDLLTKQLLFDGQGRIWGVGANRLVCFDGQDSSVLEELDGFTFYRTGAELPYQGFFSYGALINGETLLLGTRGYGLITLAGTSGTRLFSPHSLPGDNMADILEDPHGRIWAKPRHNSTLALYQGGIWQQLDAPWIWYLTQGNLALDHDGSVWASSQTGAVRFTDDDMIVYDGSNSYLYKQGYVCVDAQSTKWFVPVSGIDPDPGSAAISFDNEDWRRFNSTDYFRSKAPSDVFAGRDNATWFLRYAEGYTVMDGEDWDHLDFAADIPYKGEVYFDLDGNCYLVTDENHGDPEVPGPAVYVGQPRGEWALDLVGEVGGDMEMDSDGVMWCESEGRVLARRDGAWGEAAWSEQVWIPYEGFYFGDIKESRRIHRICIDHDGDKWFATPSGLVRVQDGGPAQQAVELSISDDGGKSVLSASLINAGKPLALDLWVAMEIDGQLLYFPDWSAEARPICTVPPGYSRDTIEIMRFDAASFGDTTYRFYAALSLTADSSLMVGARGKKIAYIDLSASR